MNSPEYSFMFNVIQEEVSNEDLYPDKTHEKSADVLYQLINNSDKAYTIGLEGGWGSGKSTVINFLNKKFDKNDSKTFFFTFDAWSHEGDPLRRNFLESLINAYDPKEKHENLQELKKVITKRKKVTESTSSRGATVFGAWLSFFLLFVPLGLALLSQVNLEGIGLDGGAKDIDWIFTIGLASVIAAPVWAIVWLIYSLFKNDGKPIFSLFETESKDTLTQDITEDEERTSIEFELYFKKIVKYILIDSSKCERILIVVDNLDRVAPEQALSLWSTLQPFFGHKSSSHDQSDFLDKVWFIVPYDKEGILSLWDENQSEHEYGASEQFESATNNSLITSDKVLSFLNKTFQTVVEVHTPLMSAWIDYFTNKVHNALVGWPEDAVNRFIDAYIKAMSNLESSPTPRQMHSVINRSGAIALQWKDQFSPEAICNYALLRSELTESIVRKSLLSGNELPSLTEELSGLLFGVPKEKGLQLLLTPEIEKVIKNGDGKALSELSEAHKKAFWVVWRASRSNWSVSSEHEEKYKINAISALYEAFKDKSNLIKSDVENTIISLKNSTHRWDLEKFDYCNAFRQLIELSEKHTSVTPWVKLEVERRLEEYISSLKTDTSQGKLILSLHALSTLLVEYDDPLEVREYEKLDLAGWVKWVEQVETANVKFNCVIPAKGMIIELANSIDFNSDKIPEDSLVHLIQTFENHPESSEWESVLEQFVSWLNLEDREGNAPDAYYLVYLVLTSKVVNSDTKSKLKSCINEQSFWNASSGLDLEENPFLPIITAISDDKFQSLEFVSQEVKNYWSGDMPESDFDNLSYCFSKNKLYDELWLLAKDDNNSLAVELIKRIEDKELFENSLGIKYIDEIELGEDGVTEAIVKKLCDNGAFKGVKQEITGEPIVYSEVIQILQEYGNENVIKEVTNIVNNISKETWFDAIKDHDSLLQCLSEPKAGFSEAFKEYLLKLIDGEVDSLEPDVFSSLLDYKKYLIDFESKTVPQITRKYIENEEDFISEALFDSFSKLLSNSLEYVSQEAIESKITQWISESNYERINWMLHCKLPRLEPDNHDARLIDYVKSALKDNEHDQYTLFKEINEKLDLNINSEELVDLSSQDEQENKQG